MISAVDLGWEDNPSKSTAPFLSHWRALSVQGQLVMSKSVKLGLRTEIFSDQDERVIKTTQQVGFRALGYSVNIDTELQNNAMWRLEYRHMEADHEIFTDFKGQSHKSNPSVGTSLSYWVE